MTKFFKFVVAFLFAVTLCSCSKDSNNNLTLDKLTGQWELTLWSADSEFSGQVYLEFKADNSFTLYQNLDAQGYLTLTGTFALGTNNVISGIYSDGKPWGSSYIITDFSQNQMKWETPSGNEASIYTRTTIPAQIAKRSRAETEQPSHRFL